MKEKILYMLKEKSPEYISGEALSQKLDVSRTAIWKYIKELKSEGYFIEASTRKGYRLAAQPCCLNSFEIGYKLGTDIVGRKVYYFDTIDSTNIYAKKIAAGQAEDGTVIAAGSQTSGRGRLGRSWNSQSGKGIYLSVILKPDMHPMEIQIITLAASVAVASAIKNTTGIAAGIKWPNDIVLDGKKVCGISTEMNSELDRINFIVLGIGINYSQMPSDFPPELRDKAVSLLSFAGSNSFSPEKFNKLLLVQAVLNELDRVYGLIIKSKSFEILSMWKSLSATLNKDVRVIYRDRELKGTAIDITNEGSLVVNCDDGITREINSGEISVRGILGYI